MKKLVTICFAIIVILAASAATYALASHYLDRSAAPAALKCTQTGFSHKVVITDGGAQPEHTTAKLCDTLTITNTDDQIRLIAFGLHENHQAYDGIIEKVLQKNQNLTVTLNKTGTYRFHDHLDDSAKGTFTVHS